MNLSWSDFKQFVTSRDSDIQYVQLTNQNCYWIMAYDAPFEVECTLLMNGDADQIDFETNIKPNANQVTKSNVVQVLGKDTLTICPFGAISTATPGGATILAAGQLTTWDVVMPTTMVLRGANFYSANAVVGDWISVQVIDKDNVTGQGGTPTSPTILGSYAISWYIMPGLVNTVEDVSISETLMQGLYLRINYTSVGSAAPLAIINFISYVGA